MMTDMTMPMITGKKSMMINWSVSEESFPSCLGKRGKVELKDGEAENI